MSLIQSPRSVKEATDPSTPDEEPPLKKRRNTNPLEENWREARCMKISQTANHWMGSCALYDSEEMAIGKHEKAKVASFAARGMKVVVIPTEATASIELPVHQAPENKNHRPKPWMLQGNQ